METYRKGTSMTQNGVRTLKTQSNHIISWTNLITKTFIEVSPFIMYYLIFIMILAVTLRCSDISLQLSLHFAIDIYAVPLQLHFSNLLTRQEHRLLNCPPYLNIMNPQNNTSWLGNKSGL